MTRELFASVAICLGHYIGPSPANCQGAERLEETRTVPSLPDFKTVKVSTSASLLPQGETEIVADANGHVVVVWMDGSPLHQAQMTFRFAYSHDAGKTFAEDQKLAESMIMADPTLTMNPHGDAYLGALRKDSPLAYRDLAVTLFRSTDAGKTWSTPVEVNDDHVFNDRPWLTMDAEARLHITFGRHVVLPDGNHDRPAYYQRSVDSGKSVSEKVLINPPSTRLADSAGGSPRGIAVTKDGRIVIGYQEIPRKNKARYGIGTFRARGSVIISHNGGEKFDPPLPFTAPATLIADVGVETARELKPFPRIKIFQNDVYAIWIGEAGEKTHGLYVAAFPGGNTAFDPPVAVTKGKNGTLTLPAFAIDAAGKIHVFWLGRRNDGLWSLFYSQSPDKGRTFTVPQQIHETAFPIQQWPGDFMDATTNDRDLFVAWPVAGGPRKGIYVSIARGVVGDR